MAEKKNEIQVISDKTSMIEINEITIGSMIYTVRNRQVMLDSDLATLYQVETKVLNQAVKRNNARFPEKYRFQLAEEEYINLKSQFVTSSLKNEHGGRRKLPYVFTEQGIAMLSAILRSEVAIKVSINIMDAFVEMRKFLLNNSFMLERINAIEVKQLEYKKNSEEKFDKIFDYIAEHEVVSQKVFFDGQIYDAFSLLVDLIVKAKSKIVLIDNYVDIGTLNILSKKQKDVEVKIFTLSNTRLSKSDIINFNKQYPKLEVSYTEKFHDRFLILDDYVAYHIGASIKDAGKKCFGINLIEDKHIIEDILQRVKLETEEK